MNCLSAHCSPRAPGPWPGWSCSDSSSPSSWSPGPGTGRTAASAVGPGRGRTTRSQTGPGWSSFSRFCYLCDHWIVLMWLRCRMEDLTEIPLIFPLVVDLWPYFWLGLNTKMFKIKQVIPNILTKFYMFRYLQLETDSTAYKMYKSETVDPSIFLTRSSIYKFQRRSETRF